MGCSEGVSEDGLSGFTVGLQRDAQRTEGINTIGPCRQRDHRKSGHRSGMK